MVSVYLDDHFCFTLLHHFSNIEKKTTIGFFCVNTINRGIEVKIKVEILQKGHTRASYGIDMVFLFGYP